MRSNVTSWIMFPPPCHGGMTSSTSFLPKTAPIPVGANTLCRENEEVAVQRLNVHGLVRHGLSTVQKHASAVSVGERDHLRGGRDRTGRIRDLGECHRRVLVRKRFLVLFEDQATGSHPWERRAAGRPSRCTAGAKERCWRGARGSGQDDLITRARSGAPSSLGNQIDAFGGTPHEGDVVLRRCIDEATNRLARALLERRWRAQPACAPHDGCSSSRAQ